MYHMCLLIEDYYIQKKLQFDLITNYEQDRMGDNFDDEARELMKYDNYEFSQFNGQGYEGAICSPDNNITFDIDSVNTINLLKIGE